MSTNECLTAYGCFFPFMLPGIITSYFIKSELLVWFIVELHICLPKYFLSLSQVIWSSCWTIHQWTFGVSTFFCLRIAVSSLLNVAHIFFLFPVVIQTVEDWAPKTWSQTQTNAWKWVWVILACMHVCRYVWMDVYISLFTDLQSVWKNVPTSLVMSQKVKEPDGCAL